MERRKELHLHHQISSEVSQRSIFLFLLNIHMQTLNEAARQHCYKCQQNADGTPGFTCSSSSAIKIDSYSDKISSWVSCQKLNQNKPEQSYYGEKENPFQSFLLQCKFRSFTQPHSAHSVLSLILNSPRKISRCKEV